MKTVTTVALSLLLSIAADFAGAGRLAMAETAAADAAGLVVIESAYDVPTTADRLVAAITAKGLKVFARIDHAAGAEAAGLALPPTELIIFGAAKVGTALMHCDRAVAVDLPLKALVWQDADGTTLLGYNSTAWLAQRYALGDCEQVLANVEKALAGLAAQAVSKGAD